MFSLVFSRISNLFLRFLLDFPVCSAFFASLLRFSPDFSMRFPELPRQALGRTAGPAGDGGCELRTGCAKEVGCHRESERFGGASSRFALDFSRNIVGI